MLNSRWCEHGIEPVTDDPERTDQEVDVDQNGDVDASALTAVVDRLRAENVLVDAAGVAGDELVVVVPRSDGASALRTVEDALASVSER